MWYPSSGQFHQYFKHAFFCPKVLLYFCQSQNVTREKLRKALSYLQCAHKMLVKLTPHHKIESKKQIKLFQLGYAIRSIKSWKWRSKNYWKICNIKLYWFFSSFLFNNIIDWYDWSKNNFPQHGKHKILIKLVSIGLDKILQVFWVFQLYKYQHTCNMLKYGSHFTVWDWKFSNSYYNVVIFLAYLATLQPTYLS